MDLRYVKSINVQSHKRVFQNNIQTSKLVMIHEVILFQNDES